jgi:predicted TPR repeat methyltransferase
MSTLIAQAETAYENGDYGDAATLFAMVLKDDPKDSATWIQLGNAHLENSQKRKALRAFKRAMDLDPEDDISRRQVAALSGNDKMASDCGQGYVEALFDGYAETFEECLVGELAYKTPTNLAEMLGDETFETVLDLGCGTGLMADALNGKFKHIDGVDLSDNMLGEAQKKEVYRDLYHGDIVSAMDDVLAADGITYDMVIAADVLLYLGDLGPVFKGAKARLNKEGLFVFTTEAGTSSKFKIQENNRFKHGYVYLATLAKAHGFDVIEYAQKTLREEEDKPVKGHHFILKLSA